MYTEVALAGPFPADFDHSGAVIEAGGAGAAAQEFRRVQAGAAGRVEDSLAGDVAEEVKACGPVVVGVEEAVLGVAEKLISKCLVLRLAPNLVLHTTHPPACRLPPPPAEAGCEPAC